MTAALEASDFEPNADVKIEKHEGIYYVEGRVQIAAPDRIVWEVITDYDNLETFMPDMVSSDSLGFDSDGGILLDQVGIANFFLFSRKIHALLEVKEDFLLGITFRQKEGDFKLYEGSWGLERADKGSVLTYSLKARPDFFVPGFLLKSLLKKKVVDSLISIALEAYRRLTVQEGSN